MLSQIFNALENGEFTASLDCLGQCLMTLTVKSVFLCSDGTWCVLICAHRLWKCQYREEHGSFHCHFQVFIYCNKLLSETSLLQTEESQALSAFLYTKDDPIPWSFSWPCAGVVLVRLHFIALQSPELGTVHQWISRA